MLNHFLCKKYSANFRSELRSLFKNGDFIVATVCSKLGVSKSCLLWAFQLPTRAILSVRLAGGGQFKDLLALLLARGLEMVDEVFHFSKMILHATIHNIIVRPMHGSMYGSVHGSR